MVNGFYCGGGIKLLNSGQFFLKNILFKIGTFIYIPISIKATRELKWFLWFIIVYKPYLIRQFDPSLIIYVLVYCFLINLFYCFCPSLLVLTNKLNIWNSVDDTINRTALFSFWNVIKYSNSLVIWFLIVQFDCDFIISIFFLSITLLDII